MNFQDARLKLLAYVRNEIRNGELTERRLARLVGISQPHAHNVLKGARTLSPQVFDLLLKYLHLSLLDLIPVEELEAQLERRRPLPPVAQIPFLETPIGPGRPWPSSVDWAKTFPAPVSPVTIPNDLLMANLADDPTMAATLAACDLALLDTSERQCSAVDPEGLYVVERGGEAVIRSIRSGARGYYLVADATLDHPAAWEPLQLSTAPDSAAVKARVVWLGRGSDRNARLQRGRLLYDPISS